MGLARRMVSRVLPGSVVVMAALTFPEFSVGAGDIAGSDGRDRPPGPIPAKDPAAKRLGAAPIKSSLSGVRYAGLITLDPAPETPALAAAALSDTLSAPAAADRMGSTDMPEPSLPATDTSRLAFVSPAASVAEPGTALTEETGTSAGLAAPASLPEQAPAAVPLARPSVAAPSETAAPALSAADRAAPLSVAASLPAPTVPAMLATPAASPPKPVSAGTGVAAPEPAAAAPAPAALAARALPAGRGAIEQLTPARIAAARAAPATPAPAPAATPAAVKAVAVPKPAVSAPGLRASAPTTAPGLAPALVSAPASAPKPFAAASTARGSAAAPTSAPAAAVAAVPKPKPAFTAPASAASSPYQLDVRAQLITRVDGKTAGAVDFRQTAAGLQVRLGSIAEVLADRYDPAQLARIRSSSAAETYISLADLQAQGIPISYDPVYDEFNVGLTDTRPKAARKVHMDQISTPERGGNAIGIPQVPRPR